MLDQERPQPVRRLEERLLVRSLAQTTSQKRLRQPSRRQTTLPRRKTTRRGPALRPQQPLGSSHTHRQQLSPVFFTEMKVSIPLQQRNQPGQKRDEALHTRVMDGSPGQKERLLHCRAIDGQTRAHDPMEACGNMVEQGNHVFAPITRQFHTVISQQHFLRSCCLLVTWSDLGKHFPAGVVAQ
jgi:hypothetical protein